MDNVIQIPNVPGIDIETDKLLNDIEASGTLINIIWNFYSIILNSYSGPARAFEIDRLPVATEASMAIQMIQFRFNESDKTRDAIVIYRVSVGSLYRSDDD